MRKLFGTDGVRGVAGEIADGGPGARARARGRRSQIGAERPRVLVIATRASRARCSRRRSRPASPRPAATVLLGGVLPTPAAPLLLAPLRLRPGGRHLGLAQPVPGQRDQVLRRRRLQAVRRGRGADRGARSRIRPASRATARPRRGRCTGRARTTCARCTSASAALDLSGVDVLLDCANGATYRAAPEIFRRLGATVDRASPTSPTGATSTTAAARRTWPRWPQQVPRRRPRHRLRVRRRRRPRARGRPHRRGRRRRRADRARGAAPARAGPAAGRRRRRHRDDQLRLPHRDARTRDRGGDDAGRRPLRARGAARARLGAGRRAVGPHHRHRLRRVRRRDRGARC